MVEYNSLVVEGDGRGTPPAPVTDPKVQQAVREFGLEGRTLYLPHMPYGGSYVLAAAIRSIGFDCWPTTHSDDRTLQLGGTVTSGEECYPQKITVGDFLRMIEDVGRDRVAFLMPEANGPCRFGQYRHLIRRTLDDLGYDDVPIVTITSNDGYSLDRPSTLQDLIRTAWRAVVAHDALMKMLLKTRPYETRAGHHRPGIPRGAARRGRGVVRARRLAQAAPHQPCRRRHALARPVPRRAGTLRPVAPPDRRGRRDLLPAEPVRQRRPRPARRGAGRRVLARRHRRVGLVRRRRARSPAGRRGPRRLAREPGPHRQVKGAAAATNTPCWRRSPTTSWATKSRTRCARCST